MLATLSVATRHAGWLYRGKETLWRVASMYCLSHGGICKGVWVSMFTKVETVLFHLATLSFGGRRDVLEMIGAGRMLPILVVWRRLRMRRLSPWESSSPERAVVKS